MSCQGFFSFFVNLFMVVLICRWSWLLTGPACMLVSGKWEAGKRNLLDRFCQVAHTSSHQHWKRAPCKKTNLSGYQMAHLSGVIGWKCAPVTWRSQAFRSLAFQMLYGLFVMNVGLLGEYGWVMVYASVVDDEEQVLLELTYPEITSIICVKPEPQISGVRPHAIQFNLQTIRGDFTSASAMPKTFKSWLPSSSMDWNAAANIAWPYKTIR